MQPHEYLLLKYFMERPDRVQTRTILQETVRGLYFDPKTSVVETHISRLRNKIDRAFDRALLTTLHGVRSVWLQKRILTEQLTADLQSLAGGLAQVASEGGHDDLAGQVAALDRFSRDGRSLVGLVDPECGEVTGNARPRELFLSAPSLRPGHELILADLSGDEDDLPESDIGFGMEAPADYLLIARHSTARVRRIWEVLDRLFAGMDAIRQVSTDLVHDLRSSLGRLRLRIEPFVTDPAQTPERHGAG